MTWLGVKYRDSAAARPMDASEEELLELYGRHSTSAWASRVFTGYRRAVPDAPEPADPADWPHS